MICHAIGCKEKSGQRDFCSKHWEMIPGENKEHYKKSRETFFASKADCIEAIYQAESAKRDR